MKRLLLLLAAVGPLGITPLALGEESLEKTLADLQVREAVYELRYTERHPAMKELQAQLAVLEAQPDLVNADYYAALEERRALLEREQRDLRSKYEEKHPRMEELRVKLEFLGETLAAREAATDEGS